MDDETGWRRFRRIKFNKKDVRRHMRKAEGVTLRHAHKFIIGRWDNLREVRRHIITWLVGVALLIALVGVQMIWLQRNFETLGPVPGGTYAEAVSGPIDTLNPLYANSGAEIAASKLLFSSLYDYDSKGHLQSELASSMQVDEAGLNYTVTIRPNVKWHDGSAVTVNDILFTTQLMKNPVARAAASLRLTWKDIVVTKLGETTVQFTLPNPNAAFPHALTFAILPEHILKEIQPHLLRESSFSKSPVGSGPFQMRRLQLVNEAEGRKIVHMSAFEKYYMGTPKLNRFQLHVFGSNKAIMTALRTNEVNAAADISSADLSQVNTAHYRILAKPVNSGVYALMNTSEPILSDKQVRKALQLGTDTIALRKILGGNLQPMDLPFAKGQLLDNDAPEAPLFNKKRAALLLEEAGWKLNKDNIRVKGTTPLELRLVTVEDTDYERALKALGDQWRQLGVKTVQTVIDPSDPGQDFTQNVLQRRDYDVLINRLVIGADPDVYAYWHSSQRSVNDSNPLGKNYSNYSNSISDTALSGALTRTSPEERDSRYKTFARQWLDDAPAIGLYQANMYYVHSKSSQTITNDEKLVSPNDRYDGVIYWTVEQGMVYKTP